MRRRGGWADGVAGEAGVTGVDAAAGVVEPVVVVLGVVWADADSSVEGCWLGVAQREAARPAQPSGISLITLGLGISPPRTPSRRRGGWVASTAGVAGVVEPVVVLGVAGAEEDSGVGCCFGVAQREAARPGQPSGISLITLGLGIGPPSTPLRRRGVSVGRVAGITGGGGGVGRVAAMMGEGGGVITPVELTGRELADERDPDGNMMKGALEFVVSL